MIFKDLISYEDQKTWFKNLNEKESKYFIYSLSEEDIGLASITKINFKDKTFEGGILCGNANYLKHWISIWACVEIYNFAFFELKLDKSYASILEDNQSAIRLNKSIGYVRSKKIKNNIGRYVLSKECFLDKSKNIQKYLKRFKADSKQGK